MTDSTKRERIADLKLRTKRFALEAIRLSARLPKTPEFLIITRQLMRSATSVGANYRAACRAKSRPDFLLKLSIVEEEADESVFWLEMLSELEKPNHAEVTRLMDEANQLLSIVIASKRTARANALSSAHPGPSSRKSS